MRLMLLSVLAGLAAVTTAATRSPTAPVVKVSQPFVGPKVNAGTVTMRSEQGKITLTLSDEVPDPKTPDPHWQVVDGQGRVYLLDRLTLKGDRMQKEITLPAYVRDVAKVVIYCAWAEANLGEASF